jgi:hypothetical protein
VREGINSGLGKKPNATMIVTTDRNCKFEINKKINIFIQVYSLFLRLRLERVNEKKHFDLP